MRIERLCFWQDLYVLFFKVSSVIGNQNPCCQGHVHTSESTTIILSRYTICPGNTLHFCSLHLWLHPWRDTWLCAGKQSSYFTVIIPNICLLSCTVMADSKTRPYKGRQTALNHDTLGSNPVQEQKVERFSTVPTAVSVGQTPSPLTSHCTCHNQSREEWNDPDTQGC